MYVLVRLYSKVGSHTLLNLVIFILLFELLSTSLLVKLITSCLFPRSVSEEPRDAPVKDNGQENEVVYSSEGFSNGSGGGSNVPRIESVIQEKDKSEVKLSEDNHDVDGYERDRDMEKALEHQAQLIGQYEAMEKAQREWEEKFRENNNSTPVCYSMTYLSHCFSKRNLFRTSCCLLVACMAL